MKLYTLTDWLGLVPVFVCLLFCLQGLIQLINRRSLFRVDTDILLLGLYYILVFSAYLLFEMIPLNYRPVLIEGRMEASYPSSTVLLVLAVMPTLVYQVNRRCKSRVFRIIIRVFSGLFSVFMAGGRLICGVHWCSDIIGSVFLSIGLYMLYTSAVAFADCKKQGGNNGV